MISGLNQEVNVLGRAFHFQTELTRRRDGGADIALFHEFAPPRTGGGHQFLRALVAELERRVASTLPGKPVVLIFGRKDPALASDAVIGRWRREFPDATYVELPDAGHYIQEDAPDAIVEAIRTAFG